MKEGQKILTDLSISSLLKRLNYHFSKDHREVNVKVIFFYQISFSHSSNTVKYIHLKCTSQYFSKIYSCTYCQNTVRLQTLKKLLCIHLQNLHSCLSSRQSLIYFYLYGFAFSGNFRQIELHSMQSSVPDFFHLA